MIFEEKVGNHLFYSSSDINFCKAKSIIRKKKYINQKNNPLENYRKKIKKRIYDKRIQNQ
jgi:hypothetical protein